MRSDRLQHAVEIAQHLVVPEADDAKACGFQKRRSRRVGFDAVLPAIDFHDQRCLEAQQVGDEVINGNLPPELRATELPVAQSRPQQRLCIGGIATKPPRISRQMQFRHARPFPLTPMLSHRPSPAKGRGYGAPQGSVTLFEKFVRGLG